MAAKKWRSRKASGVQREELAENTTRPWRSAKVTAPQRDNILQIAATLARTSGYALPEIMSGLLQAAQAGVNLDEILSESPGHLEEITVELEHPEEAFRNILSEESEHVEPQGIFSAFGSVGAEREVPHELEISLPDTSFRMDDSMFQPETFHEAWKRVGDLRQKRGLPGIHRLPRGAGSVYMCSHCGEAVYNQFSPDPTNRVWLDAFFDTLLNHNCEKGMPAKDLRVIRFKPK